MKKKLLVLIIICMPIFHLFANDSVAINAMNIELIKKEIDLQGQQMEEKKKEIETLMQYHEDAMDRQLIIYTGIFFGVLGIASWLLNWLGKKEVRNIASEIATTKIDTELKLKLSPEEINSKIIIATTPIINNMLENIAAEIEKAKQVVKEKSEIFDHELYEAKKYLVNVDINIPLTKQQKQANIIMEQKATEQIKGDLSKEAVINFLYAKALKAYDFRDFETASNYLNDVIEIDYQHSDAIFRRGYCNYYKGDYLNAKNDYEKTIELNQNNEIAYNNLGMLLMNEFENYEAARISFENAIKIEPNYAVAYINLGSLLKKFFNEPEIARELYLRAIEIDPSLKNPVQDKKFDIARIVAT